MILKNQFGKYKTMPLDWDNISGDVVEAGTPVDSSGKIANDNTAIGVVVSACDRKWSRTANVLVSGVLDELEAQTDSGLTYALECKLALSQKIVLMVNGVVDVSGSEAELSIAVAG